MCFFSERYRVPILQLDEWVWTYVPPYCRVYASMVKPTNLLAKHSSSNRSHQVNMLVKQSPATKKPMPSPNKGKSTQLHPVYYSWLQWLVILVYLFLSLHQVKWLVISNHATDRTQKSSKYQSTRGSSTVKTPKSTSVPRRKEFQVRSNSSKGKSSYVIAVLAITHISCRAISIISISYKDNYSQKLATSTFPYYNLAKIQQSQGRISVFHLNGRATPATSQKRAPEQSCLQNNRPESRSLQDRLTNQSLCLQKVPQGPSQPTIC